MNSPIEMVEVKCPVCGGVFADWRVIPTDGPVTTKCPFCGQDLATDPTIRENGPWTLIEDDDAADR